MNAFRVSRPTFRLLCEHLQILRKKDTTWRSAIPLAKRIAIALYALGSSTEYRTIASLFRFGRTTVGEIVLDFCFAVWDTFQKKLLNVYPPNQEKMEEIVKGFETLGFPQCFGAIDGCHIEIRPHQHEAGEYYNFEGWHSIVLFASVDYRYRFTYVNVGITGRSNDSTIFEISSLKMRYFENSIFKKNCRDIEGVNVPVLLIGDSAFKLTKYVKKPFPFSINQSTEQKKSNKELSKCRRVVENAFGHLKARFRRIGKGLEVNIDDASMVVKACCILHNLCNEPNDKINKKWIEELNEVEKQSGRKQPDRVSTARTESGVEVRNAIMKHFGQTPMQQFYGHKCIFLTGGTGFFGKIIIEKLIRVTDIEHIYLLIRNKKGKDVYSRVEDMFDDPVFDSIKRLKPKFQHKISIIKGDCSLPGLGINDDERATLKMNIDIVIHAAATVRFDEKLKIALAINVCGTKEVIALCRELPKLKSIVHVSTAFANCNHNLIEEKFYKPKLSGDNACRLADCLDERTLDNITAQLINDYPNTYTYTKALAEDVIRCNTKGLPICIFRPGIVIPTYKEPVPGWIDNMYGPSGIIVGVGTGILRVFHGRVDNVAHVVPVDMSVNSLLVAAWDAAMNTYDEPPIYNYVPDIDNTISWRTYIKVGYQLASKAPISRSIWHQTLTITPSKFWFNILTFFYHIIPGFLMDIGLVAMGKKPRMLQIYRKVHKFCSVMTYFSTNVWTFTNQNVRNLNAKLSREDREMFSFDMRTILWEKLVQDNIIGLRTFVVKEDPNNMETAVKRYKRLKLLHYCLMYGLYTLIVVLLYAILSNIV